MKTAILTLKNPKDKKTPLRVQFMQNGKRFCFYPGEAIEPRYWLQSSQKVSTEMPGHEEKTKYLKSWCAALNKIIYDKTSDKIKLNQEEIKLELDTLFNKGVGKSQESNAPEDFVEFMSDYIKSKKRNKKLSQKLEQTRKLVILANRLTTKKVLSEWEALSIKEKSRSELSAHYKLPFEDIDLKFIESFQQWLYNATYTTKVKGVELTQNYKLGQIDKLDKALKQFILAAIDKKLVQHFTWKGNRVGTVEVDTVYTDFREIQQIYDTELTSKTEILVRDKYVLNCFLGLRYSDLNQLENHLFRKTIIKGKPYVIYSGRNQKTDRLVEFALHPRAVEILERYKYMIPKLNISEFNETIKKVAMKAGLLGKVRIREVRGLEKIIKDVPKYELISSHAGRRSFCTNFYLEGVSIGAIMSVSGHKTEKEFRKYIRASNLKIEDVAAQVHAIAGIYSKFEKASVVNNSDLFSLN